MKISDLVKLFNRDPELLSFEQLDRIYESTKDHIVWFLLRDNAGADSTGEIQAAGIELLNAVNDEMNRRHNAIAYPKAG